VRIAFKEWAVVVDALGRGEQIVILRKGGLVEGRGGFAVEHPRFLLFPTLFHQQRESVIPSAQGRFDAIAPDFPPVDCLRIGFCCEVIAWRNLESLEVAQRLCGQHIWRDEVVAERFDWSARKGIHAVAVRVRRLPRTIELPMTAAYGGCKSWVELEQEISTEGAVPVLSEEEFNRKLAGFTSALQPATAA
jgi:hypothetical protein